MVLADRALVRKFVDLHDQYAALDEGAARRLDISAAHAGLAGMSTAFLGLDGDGGDENDDDDGDDGDDDGDRVGGDADGAKKGKRRSAAMAVAARESRITRKERRTKRAKAAAAAAADNDDDEEDGGRASDDDDDDGDDDDENADGDDAELTRRVFWRRRQMIRLLRKRRAVALMQMDTMLSVIASFSKGNVLTRSGRVKEAVFGFLHNQSPDLRANALRACAIFNWRLNKYLEPMLAINKQAGPNLTEGLKMFNIASTKGVFFGMWGWVVD